MFGLHLPGSYSTACLSRLDKQLTLCFSVWMLLQSMPLGYSFLWIFFVAKWVLKMGWQKNFLGWFMFQAICARDPEFILHWPFRVREWAKMEMVGFRSYFLRGVTVTNHSTMQNLQFSYARGHFMWNKLAHSTCSLMCTVSRYRFVRRCNGSRTTLMFVNFHRREPTK